VQTTPAPSLDPHFAQTRPPYPPKAPEPPPWSIAEKKWRKP
jgi:hypothetical protein